MYTIRERTNMYAALCNWVRGLSYSQNYKFKWDSSLIPLGSSLIHLEGYLFEIDIYLIE